MGKEDNDLGRLLKYYLVYKVRPTICDTILTQHAALGYTKQSKTMHTNLANGADRNNSMVDTLNTQAYNTIQKISLTLNRSN